MAPEAPKKRWKSNGKKFDGWDSNGKPIPRDVRIKKPDPDDLVFVQESCRCVDMDIPEKEPNSGSKINNKNPYGVPIDAKLAVALIAAWQARVKKLQEKLFGENKGQPFNDEETDTMKAILKRSSAMTVDKNILLKTLSQPGCEGLRFYLCLKSEQIDEEGKTDFLSLVTVGVNEYGRDLHYKYDEKMKKKGIDAVASDTSILSEYNSPPPPPYNLFVEDSYDNRYAILKYALDETKKLQSIKKKKKQKK